MADISNIVHSKSAKLRYTAEGVAKNLFTLPADCIVMYFLVDVQTAFNDTGSDLLELGISSDPDYFAAAVDLSIADQIIVQQFNLGRLDGGQRKVLTATYTGLNNNASAGVAEITCVFSHLKNR